MSGEKMTPSRFESTRCEEGTSNTTTTTSSSNSNLQCYHATATRQAETPTWSPVSVGDLWPKLSAICKVHDNNDSVLVNNTGNGNESKSPPQLDSHGAPVKTNTLSPSSLQQLSRRLFQEQQRQQERRRQINGQRHDSDQLTVLKAKMHQKDQELMNQLRVSQQQALQFDRLQQKVDKLECQLLLSNQVTRLLQSESMAQKTEYVHQVQIQNLENQINFLKTLVADKEAEVVRCEQVIIQQDETIHQLTSDKSTIEDQYKEEVDRLKQQITDYENCLTQMLDESFVEQRCSVM